MASNSKASRSHGARQSPGLLAFRPPKALGGEFCALFIEAEMETRRGQFSREEESPFGEGGLPVGTTSVDMGKAHEGHAGQTVQWTKPTNSKALPQTPTRSLRPAAQVYPENELPLQHLRPRAGQEAPGEHLGSAGAKGWGCSQDTEDSQPARCPWPGAPGPGTLHLCRTCRALGESAQSASERTCP